MKKYVMEFQYSTVHEEFDFAIEGTERDLLNASALFASGVQVKSMITIKLTDVETDVYIMTYRGNNNNLKKRVADMMTFLK